MLNALTALLNVTTAGTIQIFTGAMPTNTEAADTGTKLSTLTFSVTSFGAAATSTSPRGATATAAAITSDSSAAATGTAGYFRAKSSAGTVVIQGNCGTSAADMIMNTTSIVTGGTVSCSSYVLTQPDGGS
jgi:hypothetical protein